jgi:hypothetical protein
MSLAEWLQFDRRAVQRMQVVHDKYGAGPLLLRVPGRSLALLLDPQHVQLVLQNTPEPFATATKEKRAALAHFEPKNVLISSGRERQVRREYNEKVLEPGRRVHHRASSFVRIVDEEARRIVDEEARRLCSEANERGELNWELFAAAWYRVVRRVIFGSTAIGDEELSSLMARLRRRANFICV